jgi:hypothetical protein
VIIADVRFGHIKHAALSELRKNRVGFSADCRNPFLIAALRPSTRKDYNFNSLFLPGAI